MQPQDKQMLASSPTLNLKFQWLANQAIKKGQNMKQVLFTLFVVALSSFGFSQSPFTVKFNDAGFNYYAKGQDEVRTAYVHLGYDAGALTVSLSDAPSPLKVEYVEMKQTKDAKGKKVAWKKGAIAKWVQSYSLADGLNQGVNILHKASALNDVMAAYDANLKQLGFSGSTEADYANTHVSIYQNNDGAIRVIFNREGSDVNVRMTEF